MRRAWGGSGRGVMYAEKTMRTMEVPTSMLRSEQEDDLLANPEEDILEDEDAREAGIGVDTGGTWEEVFS